MSESLSAEARESICQAASAGAIGAVDHLQDLWAGYGQLLRVHLEQSPRATVIVKRIDWSGSLSHRLHPRGWNTSASHERKRRSYFVEQAFYAAYANDCPDACRVPRCLYSEERDNGILLLLEDLDAAGFDKRRAEPTDDELRATIIWLANFHAHNLGRAPEALWPIGSYWHLETRPDELAATVDPRLKDAASWFDERLRSSAFQTIIHGDAKIANICFGGGQVAAVDFQYVGGGVGVVDLAYFLSSCLRETDCRLREEELLNGYFKALRGSLSKELVDLDALEADWRKLYPIAWADFARFLSGWSPGHWKLHAYTEAMIERALETQ